ncbi:MAG TPA: 1,2-phenylacetyl-CoA epoxidase subunit PaaE [Burkholderiaceae bacterium]|nr:1,2-phenylacetyl-CoA epoxidase subunit PaaE [Burkholderiaceae bacterium]
MTSIHFHPLRVCEIQPDTDEAMVVSFHVPPELRDQFRFHQGQYLTVRGDVDGQDLRRSYSICSGLDDGTLRVGIRKVAGGVFSNWVHKRLKPGDTLDVMPPQGRFYVPLDPQAKRHYLGVAGGSGITPILSIMKTVLAREPQSRFTLIYSNRRPSTTMFKEEIEDLKNRYLTRLALHHVFTQEHVDAPLYAGRLTRERVLRFMQTLVDAKSVDHAFICGPFHMNDEVEAGLREAGIPPERIHIERFGAPVDNPAEAMKHEVRAEDADGAKVTIVRDGLQREIVFRKNDPSILDAAASAGLDVPFSCKSGVCSTCRAKVLEGHVRMDRNFALEKADLDAGFVLTCQAHPLTERVVVSYDER